MSLDSECASLHLSIAVALCELGLRVLLLIKPEGYVLSDNLQEARMDSKQAMILSL
jgi:hypothetical protein